MWGSLRKVFGSNLNSHSQTLIQFNSIQLPNFNSLIWVLFLLLTFSYCISWQGSIHMLDKEGVWLYSMQRLHFIITDACQHLIPLKNQEKLMTETMVNCMDITDASEAVNECEWYHSQKQSIIINTPQNTLVLLSKSHKGNENHLIITDTTPKSLMLTEISQYGLTLIWCNQH
jgi:hypothetical protein